MDTTQEIEEAIPFEIEDPELGVGMRWLYSLHTRSLARSPESYGLSKRFKLLCQQVNRAGIEPFLKAERNAPCPCGSGKKAKKCECHAHYHRYASF